VWLAASTYHSLMMLTTNSLLVWIGVVGSQVRQARVRQPQQSNESARVRRVAPPHLTHPVASMLAKLSLRAPPRALERHMPIATVGGSWLTMLK